MHQFQLAVLDRLHRLKHLVAVRNLCTCNMYVLRRQWAVGPSNAPCRERVRYASVARTIQHGSKS